MKDGARRSLPAARIPAVVTAVVGLSLLAAACGSSPGDHVAQLGTTSTHSASSSGPASAGESTTSESPTSQMLAFSRCMRSHGVQNFPDPDSQGNFPPLSQQALGVSKQTSLTAQQVCKHLLSSGGIATPQQRRQKLAFGVKVAQCLRAHGYPTFPDPAGLGSQAPPPGIDTNSPQFQTIETACEKQAQKALGLP
jgi:hypothetical protein